MRIDYLRSRPSSIALQPNAVVLALLGFLLAGGVALASGGYFPESWAWTSALTLVPAAALLIAGSGSRLGRLDVAFLGLFLGFGGWTLLSVVWSPSTTSTAFQAQRLLAYFGVVLLVLLLVDKASAPQLLGGCLAGVAVVAVYALLTRSLPGRLEGFDNISGYRLSDPIGYWNGLGIYAAMGVLLALGFLARARGAVARTAAAALPVLLTVTIYFTFSRGSWIALAAGFAVAVAFDPARLRLLVASAVVAPWCVVALWLASRTDALTTRGASLVEARDQGQALLLELLVLTAASCTTALGLALVDRRVEVSAPVRRVFAGVLVAVALSVIGLVWAEKGSPVSIAHSAWDDFRRPIKPQSADLNSRLFDLSANGRIEHWRVAWDDFSSHPVIGEGAGSFAGSWARQRPVAVTVKNAHSLYLETLAELGIVGLVLLTGFLCVLAVAAARARQAAVYPGAVAASAAYLVHAAGDWDWQLTGVTIVFLLAGGSVLGSARGPGTAQNSWRLVLLPFAVAGSAVALVSVLGNVPLGRSRDAVDASRWTEAAASARVAGRWEPWSSEPLRLLGEAQLGSGDIGGAHRSFTAAIGKDAENWELWLDLALASEGKERRAALEKARSLNPLSRQVDQLLGN